MSGIRHEPFARTHSQHRARGETIDRHRHDTHQLVYVSSGLVTIRTERGSYLAAPDRAMWIPAGIWHEHRFYGDTLFHSVGFPVNDALVSADQPTVLTVGRLFREVVVAYAEEGLVPAVGDHLRLVLRDALRAAEIQPQPLPDAKDPRLAAACDTVLGDLANPYRLSVLASTSGASERTLSRLFRTEFGTTYPQWRTRARVFRAMIDLAEGVSVTQTATQCGWATTSAFIATFTQVMGQTPGSYRSATMRA